MSLAWAVKLVLRPVNWRSHQEVRAPMPAKWEWTWRGASGPREARCLVIQAAS